MKNPQKLISVHYFLMMSVLIGFNVLPMKRQFDQTGLITTKRSKIEPTKESSMLPPLEELQSTITFFNTRQPPQSLLLQNNIYVMHSTTQSTLIAYNKELIEQAVPQWKSVEKAAVYTCEFCKKSFIKNSVFIIHRRMHTGERPYQCITCKRSFTQLSNCRAHVNLHKEEDPLTEKIHHCLKCDKTFADFNNLKKHQKIHKKRHPCPYCDKTFATSNKLIIHVRTHTGERPYQKEIFPMIAALQRNVSLSIPQTNKSDSVTVSQQSNDTPIQTFSIPCLVTQTPKKIDDDVFDCDKLNNQEDADWCINFMQQRNGIEQDFFSDLYQIYSL